MFDETKVNQLSSDAFVKNATLNSFACRTGAGASIGYFSLYSSMPENSLAQQIANKTGLIVTALQSRSLYTGILGNKFTLTIKDKLGTSTNRDPNGNTWMNNVQDILFPTKGQTPYNAPGFTIFRKGKEPETVDDSNKKD